MQRAGLSLLEVAISTLLVGLVVVGSLRAVGASLRSSAQTSQHVRGVLLAEDLMSEILQQPYADRNDDSIFGHEPGDASAASSRSGFDDVDDYDGWDESPLIGRDGVALAGTAGWRRRVFVAQVKDSDLLTAVAPQTDTGVKRITVSVSYRGETVVELVCVQTSSWIPMVPEPGNNLTTGRSPDANQSPRAFAMATPASGNAPLNVAFDARGSTDPEDQPLSYAWSFGDGTSGTGPQTSHAYSNTGVSPVVRSVTLTATDVMGAQSQHTVSITVYP